MAEMLTPQQREAVYNRGGKLLVSAAAGSGKTKVLVDRLLSYITDPIAPANIDDFLIITYTKAAASELRGKIAAKLSERIAEDPGNRHLQQQMQRLYLAKISTVHAFCADLLREYAYLLDIPADFRVADENECLELQIQVLDQIIEHTYETAAEDPDFQSFVNNQGFGRDDSQIPEILLSVHNRSRCHLNPDGWLDWCIDSSQTKGIKDVSETIWGEYLIRDLQTYLHLQIEAMQRCVTAATCADGMEKPAALLASIVQQLQSLSEAVSWDEILKRKSIDYGRLTFSKKCTDQELAERIKAVRNQCKIGLEKKLRSFAVNSLQVLCDLENAAASTRGLIRLVREFSKEYARRKKNRRFLDFSDLEHKTLDLLLGKSRSAPTALASQIGERYREIMVDEYQDSNSVQDAIFDSLTCERKNCFMVGDVKQSIYQFRLADPRIFIEKYNSYVPASEAEPLTGRKVLLSSNFRSSGGVIQAVNDVFSNCMSREVGGITYNGEEMLREGIEHIPLCETEVELYGIDVQEDTYAEEAAFVARKIHDLLDGTHYVREGNALRPVRAEDIVILLRSPGSVGSEFVYAIEQYGIGCTTGGSIDLLQTEEITILRSLLQVINNPLQEIHLVALLMTRIIAFSADDLARIRGKSRRYSIYEMLCRQDDGKSLQFVTLLQDLRSAARRCSVPQLLQYVFLKTSMDSLYAALPDGTDRKNNLHLFYQLASDFDNIGQRDLAQFLEHLDAMEKKGLVYTSDSGNSNNVTIMSIHKSKGLEFPIVFLCGLSRSFNQESMRAQVLCDRELGIGLNCVDIKNRVRYPTIAKKAIAAKIYSDSISEEMRVLYVAMTRARDRLIMTYAAKNIDQDLTDIALRMDMTPKNLMTAYVNCPGEWVLQTAMKKIEAGDFFNVTGRPDNLSLQEPAWGIHLVTGAPLSAVAAHREAEETIAPNLIQDLKMALDFTYPHIEATQAPSKLTATQMKGRIKDQEVAEHTNENQYNVRNFRKTGFTKTSAGRQRGNAVHAVKQ